MSEDRDWTTDYDLYAGFYQGLAWAQGAIDGPLKFNWPNELLRRGNEATFDRQLFFRIVADLDDEGNIHYWENYGGGCDQGVLHCTEDPTPKLIPHHAHTAAAIYRAHEEDA